MFGKKKDQEMSPTSADTSSTTPASDQSKSYLRQDAPTPGVSRPAAPEIARRPPDLSAFTQRRDQPTAPRAGDPREIGPVICFMASRVNSYMTGANINVDGGSDFT